MAVSMEDALAAKSKKVVGFHIPTFTPLFMTVWITGQTIHLMEQAAPTWLIAPLTACDRPDERHCSSSCTRRASQRDFHVLTPPRQQNLMNIAHRQQKGTQYGQHHCTDQRPCGFATRGSSRGPQVGHSYLHRSH